jgi:dihydrofolate synthase/folylpolyglutamate synthase
MTYSEAVSYLESLIDYERTPAGAAAARVWNLDRMREMAHAVGDPHLELRCLHIAGTKGKGSTAAMAEAILRAAGHHTGLYSSPHLVSFRERITADGAMIGEDEVVSLVEEVAPVIDSLRNGPLGPPSFFEAYTLLAFLHFVRRGVELAIIEVGLGGRLDATNVVSPLACGLTRIGLDHTLELGETLAEVAREKAGIIKDGVSVISAPQSPEALEVFQEVCLERRAQLFVVGDEPGPTVSVTSSDRERQTFTVRGMRGTYGDLTCPLLGAHQAENAAVAVGLVELLAGHDIEIGEDAVREGIDSVEWPGRFQIVSRRPYVILDGAHDELGAAALAESIESLFPGARVILVLGVGGDKDAAAIARPLCPLADDVIATASSSPRSLDAYELQRAVFSLCRRTSAFTPVSLAVREAIGRARSRDVVLITGSLYVVGEAMQALNIGEVA